MRHPLRIALPLLAAAALAACSAAPSGSPGSSSGSGSVSTTGPTNETLRVVSDFINPTFADPAPDYIEISYGNAEMLLRPKLNDTEPWLAESVTQTSPTVWRITLRPGLTFQNGHPLDAAALKAWFEYEWKNDAASKGLVGNPTAVSVVDPVTVEITLPKPHNPFLSALANYTCAVYDSAEVAKVNGKFEQLAGKGIFTGPYAYTSSAAGTVTYTRNTAYWGGTPPLAGIQARKIDDQQVGLQAVANGEADLMMVPAVKLKRQAQRFPDLTYLTSDLAAGYAAFNLNPAKAPFTDVAVRQAFALAIDNDAISKTVMDGVWRGLPGVFPADFEEGVTWKTHDPAKAATLLDGAGWVKGADGIRTKGGEKLSATIITYTDDLEAVGTASVEMLRDVGFDAQLKRVPDYSAIPSELPGPGPVNAQLLNLENFGLDGNAHLAMARNYQFDKNYNLVVRDKEIAALFDTVLSSQDQAAVTADFKKAQQLNGERVYYVPVTDEPTTMLVSKRYAHLTVDPFYLFIDAKTRPQG